MPLRLQDGGARLRLRRSNIRAPGISRRRHGTGFSYRHPDGSKLSSDELRRVKALAVPPAWSAVWICPAENGHIQAAGTDDAGRRQYIYHPRWRELRDREKFDRALAFGRTLTAARRRVTLLLRSGDMTREVACAAAFRLLDSASLRIGSDVYAEENGSYGVTTLLVSHVQVHQDTIRLDFPGKSGLQWDVEVKDPDLAGWLALGRGRKAGDPAIGYCNDDGSWSGLAASELNDFIHGLCGQGFSAKDFRTWQGTVAAAVELARYDGKPGITARRKAVAAAIKAVAERLGNTPAVARSSYVDPRLVDRFMDGQVPEAVTYSAAERSLPAFLGNEEQK
ncbi:DNA topoisomerase IB [Arthrobacter sp. NPDC055138]